MKKMKKLFSLALALVMMMALVVTAGATSGTNNDTGVITIDNAIPKQDYSAYQLLVLESYNNTDNAFAYKVAEAWAGFFETPEALDYVSIDADGYVTWKKVDVQGKEIGAAEFAQKALAYAQDKNHLITATQTATAAPAEEGKEVSTVTFNGLNLGYYLIDSSAGALCSLDTTNTTVEIEEKNKDSGITKTLIDKTNKKIGDDVKYEIEVEIVKGAENYTVSDTMGAGLSYNGDVKVELVTKTTPTEGQTSETTTTIDASDYDVTTPTGKAFEIKFHNDYLTANESTATVTKTIKLTYSAKITKEALIVSEVAKDEEGNTWNQATLTYGNNKTIETPKHGSDVELYKITVNKVDSKDQPLTGAKFNLYIYDEATKTTVNIPVVKEGSGTDAYYRPALKGETPVNIEAGTAVIKGVEIGTYYLEEIEAPKGYNKLTAQVPVVSEKVTDSGTKVETVVAKPITGDTTTTVMNMNGTELPATGGIGTTIFTVTGAILMIGAAVLFLTKKRSEV